MIKKFISWLRTLIPKRKQHSGYSRLHLYALPADYGDAMLIQYVGDDEQNHYIWIDGGLMKSYEHYHKTILSAISEGEESVDLMVVSHVDRDHIGGILAMAADPDAPHEHIKRYWFNASRNLAQYFNTRHHPDREISIPQKGLRSIDQGMKLESFLQKENKWHQKPIMGFQHTLLHGMDIMVLGPKEENLRWLAERWEDEMSEEAADRSVSFAKKERLSLEELAKKAFDEDDSKANASSIVLALEYEGYRILLPGDAHPSDLADAIVRLGFSKDNPMVLDAFKLSHHGSKGSLSPTLLDLVDCRHYIISTDGSRYGLPHREALARILMHPRNHKRGTTFYFNYDNPTLRNVFSKEEIKSHRITCTFPENPALGAVMSF